MAPIKLKRDTRTLGIVGRSLVYGDCPQCCGGGGGPACCNTPVDPSRWFTSQFCASRDPSEPPIYATVNVSASGTHTTSGGTESYQLVGSTTRQIRIVSDSWGQVGGDGLGNWLPNNTATQFLPPCGAAQGFSTPIAAPPTDESPLDLVQTANNGTTTNNKVTIEVGIAYYNGTPINNQTGLWVAYFSLARYALTLQGQYVPRGYVLAGMAFNGGTYVTRGNSLFGGIGPDVVITPAFSRSGCSGLFTQMFSRVGQTAFPTGVVNENMSVSVAFGDSPCTSPASQSNGCTNCGNDTATGGLIV